MKSNKKPPRPDKLKHLYAYRKERVKKHIKRNTKTDVSMTRPQSLTSEVLLKIKPAHIEDREWIDHCRYITHLILKGQLSERRKHDNHFIELYSGFLVGIIGYNYRMYIKALIRARIIIRSKTYSIARGKSYGYKLTLTHAKSRIVFSTIKDMRLRKAVLKYRMQQETKLIKKSTKLPAALFWLTTNGLGMDKISATSCLNSYKSLFEKRLGIYDEGFGSLNSNEMKAFIEIRYKHTLHQIQNFSTKSFSIDSSGGRLYTSLTGLSSPYRNFLTYDNQPLVYLDIKNSQPFHFLFLLQERFWKRRGARLSLNRLKEDLFKVIDKEQTITNIIKQIRSNDPNILSKKNSQETDIQLGENNTFCNLVLSGKLYEFILDSFKGKYLDDNGVDRFNSRRKTKSEFIKMMYYDQQEPYSKQIKVFEEFAKSFPLEASLMFQIKNHGHNQLAILLQKIEATMILDVIPQMIFDKDPNIPIFTIHDGIVVPEAYRSIVEAIIKTAYLNELGAVPTLEIKSLSQENAYSDMKEYVSSKIEEAGFKQVRSLVKPPGYNYDHESTRSIINGLFSINQSKMQFPFSYEIYAPVTMEYLDSNPNNLLTFNRCTP